jgi:hypothetical protein
MCGNVIIYGAATVHNVTSKTYMSVRHPNMNRRNEQVSRRSSVLIITLRECSLAKNRKVTGGNVTQRQSYNTFKVIKR